MVDVSAAAARLLEARRTRQRLTALSESERPGSVAEAYAVQDAVAQALGPVGAWKIGAKSPTDTPLSASIQQADVIDSGASLPRDRFNIVIIEAEVAFRFGRDLPANGAPYDDATILAAIESAHPAIEIVDTRFAEIDGLDAFSKLADFQMNGALVVGPALRDWQALDLKGITASVTIDGFEVIEKTGANPAGDPRWLALWAANNLIARGQPIRAGQVVTTGSYIGMLPAPQGGRIVASLSGVGSVSVTIS
ncbi:MAG: 2-keto-4-pentenoate hydratase [Alphaproteobacteria bacterium]|nr:2-keto-4-pentenoate hydratase [Alphaproteobacteria bacterium]MBU0799160.1 2-keto-4-pentenoate hydratase [Alphaproteobacteria bacterium]MBU0888811.1 2-keto-4-pentenoate hydratase [Alphaproteobacteria bacterium]MBU1813831.1 2-keto-4-pentenoate hydratase [Alphaproteobacteria bacterium]MBU2091584.1 2-keto-4-pentenoate hydratase [Alphaproteobacteria bacterium]